MIMNLENRKRRKRGGGIGSGGGEEERRRREGGVGEIGCLIPLISGAASVLGEAPGVKTGIHNCQSGTLRATSDTHIL